MSPTAWRNGCLLALAAWACAALTVVAGLALLAAGGFPK